MISFRQHVHTCTIAATIHGDLLRLELKHGVPIKLDANPSVTVGDLRVQVEEEVTGGTVTANSNGWHKFTSSLC